MDDFAFVSFWVLIGAAAVQLAPGIVFAWVLRRRRLPPPPDEQLPKAAVLLGLRGHDPFLKDCIAALVNQDYPNYDVWIMLDHPDDPAMHAVQTVMREQQPVNLHVKVVTDRRDDCSLLNNNAVQTVRQLDDSHEVFVLLDADVNPQSDWLRTLVAPLADEQVGVASGNRWYMPSVATLGSLIRYVWNAAAVVQMYVNHFTWGGSLAIKAKILRETDLLERWSTAISLDTPIFNELRKTGLRSVFIPQLMMVNRESCGLRGFCQWVTRQMLVGRLYHPGWLPVLAHGILSTVLLLSAMGALIVAVVTAHWTAAIWIGGGLLGCFIGMVLFLALLEGAVREVVRTRGEATHWLSRAALPKLILAIPLTQFVYGVALLRAIFMRQVHWRGVDYRLERGGRVRLLEYRPFPSSEAAPGSLESL